MERSEFFAEKFRTEKKNGNNLPDFAKLLSKKSIDYDRVEGLLWAEPNLISNLRCTMEEGGLSYEVPCGLHRDIQACNLRAVSIVCLALTNEDFLKLSTKISRRKKEYLRGVRMRFQSAQKYAS